MVIYSNGFANYVPPGIFLSTCPINIAYFPFDDQECAMKVSLQLLRRLKT